MSTELSSLEDRVRWLMDVEEIKQLKARYAIACDDGYDADVIAGLFTEDAIWEGGALGRAETREGIRSFFRNSSEIVSFAVHGIGVPLIDVSGDRATGRWYLDQPMVLKDGDAAFWLCAQYHDDYVRTAEGWRFQKVVVETRAFSPYAEGFGKTLIAELPN